MRRWPEWMESLRPDEITSARLRRSIMQAAAPLLEERREDVWDIASRWAGLLTPVAAVLALVFGGLAMRHEVAREMPALAGAEPTAEFVDFLGDAVPAGFSETATDDDVAFAALVEAARQRPRVVPTAPEGERP